METRESYITPQAERFVTTVIALDPAEDRLIKRLRQLAREQCRGVMIVFEPGGFGLFKLDKQEKMSS